MLKNAVIFVIHYYIQIIYKEFKEWKERKKIKQNKKNNPKTHAHTYRKSKRNMQIISVYLQCLKILIPSSKIGFSTK